MMIVGAPPAPAPAAPRPRRRTPRPKWLLVTVLVGTFICALALNGLMTSEIGVDERGAGPDGPDEHVPAAFSRRGGPRVDHQ